MHCTVTHTDPPFQPGKLSLYGLTFLVVLLLAVCLTGKAETSHVMFDKKNPSDIELKAIYLYNFLKFVKWPEGKCPQTGGVSQEIAVLGDSDYEPVLKSLQQKLKSRNQDLKLTFYGPYKEGINYSPCCLLFITQSEVDNLPDILENLRDKPVLTVADSDAFLEKGVMITMISHNDKIRWAINREPLQKAGLRLSAKLLDIAIQVIN